MKTKDFFRKIFSLKLWANLLAMLLVVVLLCWGVKIGIDIYTHHGEKIKIPDVRHKLFADAEHILNDRGLQVVVSDTGYVKTLPPDCILEQSPEAGKEVKSGRVIYVVINSSSSPMLTVPDIIDNCSYREARAKLVAMGFKVGPTEFIPGEKDWVYGLKSKGKSLHNGQKVSVNDVLVLQIGDGMRDMNDSIIYADPDLYYGDEADSTMVNGVAEPALQHGTGQESDVDEFEVVTGPE
ncbi:PASTA domain-containing protein [uncultured Prevotella sp.]|uniref:PASTA domain-containing protein n=1 Tax=uncultured Prevotella sp. TaxID=159272 RepID=UPI00261319A2|nr:PASTA domain-containing protein [uncultured Prevotella sp.]